MRKREERKEEGLGKGKAARRADPKDEGIRGFMGDGDSEDDEGAEE